MVFAMRKHPRPLTLPRRVSMTTYIIYQATNKVNNKSYIGFTNNFDIRKKNHINASKTPTCTFHYAILKHSPENFDWRILYCSQDKNHCLREMEQHFIDEHNSMLPNGYNTCRGGGGGNVSIKHKERMKTDNPMVKLRTNNGSWGIRPPTPDTDATREKKRISKLGNLNPNFGNAANGLNYDIRATCMYCNLSTNIGNITRWHNDNCKKKPQQ